MKPSINSFNQSFRARTFLVRSALFCLCWITACSDRKADEGPLLFSKGVTKVLSVERILDTKARIETERSEYGITTIKGISADLNDFGARGFLIEEHGVPNFIPNRFYDVTIYQKSMPTIDSLHSPRPVCGGIKREVFWHNLIIRIKEGQNIIYDASVCKLHNQRMRFAQVAISYGYPMPPSQDYMEAHEKRFPNGVDYTLGGCVRTDDIVDRKFICDQCASEYSKWQHEEYEKKQRVGN
ncbi:hypothetical protein M2447_002294 [Ereboglobus sp. PH5-10]|uniref:hypothetical protein n=1 Tax=Ereboglobus sp. PH5-10 TaxID=2940629 RepID=UPI002404C7D3|nr:hypothetical protein [Ereboglobus sp. PH5-10]MDF9828176.1 hypothetical protein [Ereboglobus sp. PH5-10]